MLRDLRQCETGSCEQMSQNREINKSTRVRESNIYLPTVRRHRWRSPIERNRRVALRGIGLVRAVMPIKK